MGLLGVEEMDSLQDLLFHQLEDVYDAEKRLVDALSSMQQAAHNVELKNAFAEHQRETEGHVDRLEQVFRGLGREPEREACPAMKGLIQEGQETIEANGQADVLDAALIAAAQRVEHYEMAAYGTIRQLAEQLNDPEAAKQAEAILKEEKAADDKLNSIAGRINPVAAQPA